MRWSNDSHSQHLLYAGLCVPSVCTSKAIRMLPLRISETPQSCWLLSYAKACLFRLSGAYVGQYITKEEPLASPRGKLEIGESIKTQVLRKKQLVCAYDEFSVNAYTNRIIKTTMAVLLRADISKTRKKEIRKLLVFFDGVDTLDAHNINWNIQYDRNNQTYG